MFCGRAPRLHRNQPAVHHSSKLFTNQSFLFYFSPYAFVKSNPQSRSPCFAHQPPSFRFNFVLALDLFIRSPIYFKCLINKPLEPCFSHKFIILTLFSSIIALTLFYLIECINLCDAIDGAPFEDLQEKVFEDTKQQQHFEDGKWSLIIYLLLKGPCLVLVIE